MKEKIGSIVLAAGGARRLGRPKMLVRLPNGKTVIRHVVDIVLESGLSPVIVVLGKSSETVIPELKGLACRVVINKRWEDGMSTSLQTGLQNLDQECRACVVVLGDQPFQTPELMQALVDRYTECGAPIVYPTVDGQHANPVLLDRITFSALNQLTGDVGARKIFSAYKTCALPWHDERLPFDLDTETDVRRAQSLMHDDLLK